ncbi:MAG: hypothetical protein E3K32_05335 [wastewater metagenome]|nr:hypothetical protein [Candidatus Loosdrechtia aerotolerans]
MNISNHYEELPLADMSAPRAISKRNRSGGSTSGENAIQDLEDGRRILKLAGLNGDRHQGHIIDAKEKYLVETQPVNGGASSEASNTGMRQKGMRKPHYTKLLLLENRLVFQAACCLPLKVIAASFDGMSVSGRILFSSHSEQEGGKLVYEFMGKGNEVIIDLKRGESTRAQRIIFCL